MKKRIMLLTIATVLGSSNLVQALPQIKNTVLNTTVESRKDNIQYVYEVRDGQLYKRLYNYSKGTWVGNWILCK